MLLYLASVFLVTRPVGWKMFDHVTLTITFDLHLNNLNIGCNFCTVRGRAFIFGMCVPCDKTLLFMLLLPEFLIM